MTLTRGHDDRSERCRAPCEAWRRARSRRAQQPWEDLGLVTDDGVKQGLEDSFDALEDPWQCVHVDVRRGLGVVGCQALDEEEAERTHCRSMLMDATPVVSSVDGDNCVLVGGSGADGIHGQQSLLKDPDARGREKVTAVVVRGPRMR